jgi:hypothetical protein
MSPLTEEQKKILNKKMKEIEDSDSVYGEIRLIFKRPFWRHIQKMDADNLPAPKDESEKKQ